MEEKIRKLVQIDQECSQRVNDAKRKNADMQQHMHEKRKDIYALLSTQQQQKKETYKRQLEQQSQEEQQQQEYLWEQKTKQLETMYEENKESWIAQIVERCLQ